MEAAAHTGHSYDFDIDCAILSSVRAIRVLTMLRCEWLCLGSTDASRCVQVLQGKMSRSEECHGAGATSDHNLQSMWTCAMRRDVL